MPNNRLIFGPRKYIALNLMLARWLSRVPAIEEPICYVTMGGSELQDIVNFCWANYGFVKSVISYEQSPELCKHAKGMATHLKQKGIDVSIIEDDLFEYRRSCDHSHVYFVDLLGRCSLSQYSPVFQTWFENEVIRAGDFLMVTSYLGRNPGWIQTLKPFEAEFNAMHIETTEEKVKAYDVMHPAFVLYRALRQTDFSESLRLTCLGHIRYRDTSPMGLYGFLCEEGPTEFTALVENIPWLDTVHNNWGR